MQNLTLEKLNNFYKKKQKTINIVLVVLLVAVLGGYYYIEQYKKPREEKANELIFGAQKSFAIDSFSIALNGQGNQKGFLYVIKQYAGTKAANLAYYYSGVIYLKQGMFDKSIDMLEKFSAPNDVFKSLTYNVLADAYSEKKQYEKAIELYEKASDLMNFQKNNFGAECLLKAGFLYEQLKKDAEAIKMYEKIIKNFSGASQKSLAEKHLARLGFNG